MQTAGPSNEKEVPEPAHFPQATSGSSFRICEEYGRTRSIRKRLSSTGRKHLQNSMCLLYFDWKPLLPSCGYNCVCVSVCLCIVCVSTWWGPSGSSHSPEATSWLPLILHENAGRVVGGASGQHLARTKHRLWESWGRAGHSRVYYIYKTQKPLKCHAPRTPYRPMNSAMSNKKRALSGGKINPCGENRALSLADMSIPSFSPENESQNTKLPVLGSHGWR